MTSTVCGTPLGNCQGRCSDCGYLCPNPLDLHADVAPSGVPPKEVILAAKLLALSMVVNAGFVLLAFIWIRMAGFMPDWAIWMMAGSIAFHGLFMALIWRGVGWARMLFLAAVGCRAGVMIWGLTAIATGNHMSGYLGGLYAHLSIDLAIDFLVAYLLLQPGSRSWFYGRSDT